jgi:hypothetical protein
MTEEERRFKIKKIEKYDELAIKEEGKIVFSTICTCIAAATCIFMASQDLTNFASNDIVLASGIEA